MNLNIEQKYLFRFSFIFFNIHTLVRIKILKLKYKKEKKKPLLQLFNDHSNYSIKVLASDFVILFFDFFLNLSLSKWTSASSMYFLKSSTVIIELLEVIVMFSRDFVISESHIAINIFELQTFLPRFQSSNTSPDIFGSWTELRSTDLHFSKWHFTNLINFQLEAAAKMREIVLSLQSSKPSIVMESVTCEIDLMKKSTHFSSWRNWASNSSSLSSECWITFDPTKSDMCKFSTESDMQFESKAIKTSVSWTGLIIINHIENKELNFFEIYYKY